MGAAPYAYDAERACQCPNTSRFDVMDCLVGAVEALAVVLVVVGTFSEAEL